MKTVAVIGLGIMGHGIADNFLKNGYKVTVWNRTADKATKELRLLVRSKKQSKKQT
jgi:3-hydroxyisobutyrate dehydrogenase-like beta-hydroxyacid dehydrogenase